MHLMKVVACKTLQSFQSVLTHSVTFRRKSVFDAGRFMFSFLLGSTWTRATQLGHIASGWTCKELCGAAWSAPRKQHDFFELQGTRAGCVPQPFNTEQKSKFIAKWTCAGPAWNAFQMDSQGLTWTGADPPISPPWIRKISYLTQGSTRNPSKTAFTRDCLCFPRSKWSTVPPKPTFAEAFVWKL